MRRIVVALNLCAASVVQAEDCSAVQTCVEQGWQVNVALGLGARSNPLDGGDRIPLVVMPDISWYGDNAYFDNGEFGAQWSWSEDDAFDLFLAINSERAYFSFWHPKNIFLTRVFVADNAPDQPGFSAESIALNIENIGERHWAVDAGLRWHHYRGAGEWQIALLGDASGVHHGQQFSLRYQHQWSLADGELQTFIGATWKSAALIDYYYGIDQHDHVAPELYYRGQSGWQPELGVSYTLAINKEWQWLMRASIVKLHDGMTRSPIVADERVTTVFMGVTYHF